MNTSVDPNKVEELASEFKRLSKIIETNETGMNREISRLIQDTNSKYSEPYVRQNTAEMDVLLREIRILAKSITSRLNDKVIVLNNAANIYRAEEEKSKKLAQNLKAKTFIARKTLVSRSGSALPKKRYTLGEGTNKLNTAKSKEIKELQKALEQLGFLDTGEAYGYFGTDTLRAVNAFKDKYMPGGNKGANRGVLGEQTWAEIKKQLAKIDESGDKATSPKGTIFTEPAKGLSISQQNEYYIKKLGFTIDTSKTAKSNGTCAVQLSSALIILQWYSEIKINGNLNDKATLEKLKELAQQKDIIKKIQNKMDKWNPEKPTIDKTNKSDYAKNGNYELLKDRLVAIPTADGKGGYLERNTAVAWAMMVQEAVEYNSGKNKPYGTLNIGRFMPNWENGFRSLERQQYFWKLNGYDSSRAMRPGESNHGWGLAIDFTFTDKMEGPASSNELKWLEALTKQKNSKFNKFMPNLHSEDVKKYKKNGNPNPKWGPPINKDGSYNYYETWHWSYYTKL